MSGDVEQYPVDPSPSASYPAAPPPPSIPVHVAANIVEFLKRVDVKGMEAFALVEAMGIIRQFAGPAPTGPGVPFPGL